MSDEWWVMRKINPSRTGWSRDWESANQGWRFQGRPIFTVQLRQQKFDCCRTRVRDGANQSLKNSVFERSRVDQSEVTVWERTLRCRQVFDIYFFPNKTLILEYVCSKYKTICNWFGLENADKRIPSPTLRYRTCPLPLHAPYMHVCTIVNSLGGTYNNIEQLYKFFVY